MKLSDVIAEFLRALSRRHTYDPRKNMYVWFGLFWGAGAPLLWVLFQFEPSQGLFGLFANLEECERFRVGGSLAFFPPFFSVIFGAIGTTRHDQARLVSQTFAVLDDEVERRTEDLQGMCLETVLALSQSIEAKDPYTRGHCYRVWKYAERAALRLGLSEGEIEDLRFACFLHDIGKIKIPGSILHKQGELTKTERDIIRSHPAYGEQIVSHVTSFKRVAELILYHHERCDGSGYPAGLKDSQIPYLAKIIAVADTLDAMTTTRPYRMALGLGVAIEELRRCSGLPFSPELAPGRDSGPCFQFTPEIVECMTDGLTQLVFAEDALGQFLDEDLRIESYLDRGKKLNCWEVRGCGREKPGTGGMPLCPVVTASHADGANAGVSGGRVCWSIVGAFCSRNHQAKNGNVKERSCATCDFFQRVREEEGLNDFVLFPELVRGSIEGKAP